MQHDSEMDMMQQESNGPLLDQRQSVQYEDPDDMMWEEEEEQPQKKGWLAKAWHIANETGTVKVTVWTILTIVMSAFGGWLFAFVEGPNMADIRHQRFDDAKERLENRTEYLERVVQDVINLDADPSITLETKPDAIRSVFEEYEKLMKVDTSVPVIERDPWTPLNSIFFTSSLFTTIGYGGRNYPLTTAGRICTMVYSVITIPVLLTMTSDLGLVIFEGIYWVWWRTKKLFCPTKKPPPVKAEPEPQPAPSFMEGEEMSEMPTQAGTELVEEEQEREASEAGAKSKKKQKQKIDTGENILLQQQREATFPMSMGLLMSLMSLLFCSGLVQLYEPTWSFFDANYYFVSSFLTIGLGDVSPTAPKTNSESTLIPHIVLMIFSMTFIGMSRHVLSKRIELSYAMIVNGIHMEFREREAKAGMDVKKGIQLSAEGEIDRLAKKLSFLDRFYYSAMDNSSHRLLVDLWKRKANMKNEEIQVALPKRDIGLQHLAEVDDITPIGDWKAGEDYGLPVKIPEPENPYIKYLYNLD